MRRGSPNPGPISNKSRRPAPVPFFFFFNDTATTEIYPLSLHDALPILRLRSKRPLQGERVLRIGGEPFVDRAVCAIKLDNGAAGGDFYLHVFSSPGDFLGSQAPDSGEKDQQRAHLSILPVAHARSSDRIRARFPKPCERFLCAPHVACGSWPVRF